jgi:hypothetical protein
MKTVVAVDRKFFLRVLFALITATVASGALATFFTASQWLFTE